MSQWPQVAPSLPECHVSVVLPAAVMLQVTVAPDVAEDNVPSKHHTDTTEAPFPHIDILIVIPVITSAEGTHDAAGGEVPHGQPGGQLAHLDVQQLHVLQGNRRLAQRQAARI